MNHEPSIQTVEKQKYDVIVVGGGIGGVSAAVAAGRAGCRVLLIEKGVYLGGLATAGLISWYEPLCDGEGHRMMGGIGEELIRLSVSCGFDNLPPEWGGSPQPNRPYDRYANRFSPTFFALALDTYVQNAGVRLLFDSRATYPVMESGRCLGILVENINGREFYPADIVIDATGDASISHRAGIPCEVGDNYLSCVVHDFDLERAKVYAEDGNLSTFRHWNFCGSNFYGKGHPEGMPLLQGVRAEDVTDFVLAGRALVARSYEGTDRRTRDMMMLPSMPQYRTVRHIVGKTLFDGTREDFVYEDSIGAIGDFRKCGKHYTVPYSALYHPDFPNLLTAGRIISASGEGWEITRVIPGCALTGQAAGVAAALAKHTQNDVTRVPYSDLRASLEAANVQFDIRGVGR